MASTSHLLLLLLSCFFFASLDASLFHSARLRSKLRSQVGIDFKLYENPPEHAPPIPTQAATDKGTSICVAKALAPEDKLGDPTLAEQQRTGTIPLPQITENDVKGFVWAQLKQADTTTKRILLASACDLRNHWVLETLKWLAKEHKFAHIQAVALGSVTLSSDLDVTLAGPDANSLLRKFNERFEALFPGRSSSSLFDTNLYADAWVLDTAELSDQLWPQCFQPKTVTCRGSQKHLLMIGDNSPIARKQQHYWAFAKFIAFGTPHPLTNGAIDDFVSQVKNVVRRFPSPSGNEIVLESNRIYADAHTRSKATLNEHLDRGASLLKEEIVAYGEVDPLGMGDAEVNRRNAFFADKLDIMYNAIYQKIRPLDCATLKHIISTASFHAIEAYWTEGAYLMVVRMMQSGCTDLGLSHDQLLDAALENIGDVFKVTQEFFHTGPFSAPETGFTTEQMTLMGKYSFRIGTAFELLDALVTRVHLPLQRRWKTFPWVNLLKTAFDAIFNKHKTKTVSQQIKEDIYVKSKGHVVSPAELIAHCLEFLDYFYFHAEINKAYCSAPLPPPVNNPFLSGVYNDGKPLLDKNGHPVKRKIGLNSISRDVSCGQMDWVNWG